MPSESSTKSSHSPSNNEGDEKHRHLDREIREMMSAITHGVTGFHKSGSTHKHSVENEDGHDGLRIITLAGTNDGATLKSELDEKSAKASNADPEALSTFVNSNFQAINNSIMLGGSYQANDPGVHLDISDFSHPQSHHHKAEKHEKKEKSKKDTQGSKSEPQFGTA